MLTPYIHAHFNMTKNSSPVKLMLPKNLQKNEFKGKMPCAAIAATDPCSLLYAVKVTQNTM